MLASASALMPCLLLSCGVWKATEMCFPAGAGKSSLINSLFRLMELDSGSIRIDSLDISRMGVRQLRSKMAIIPQVSSSLRAFQHSCLDPCRQRLRVVHLQATGCGSHLCARSIRLLSIIC